jgi:parallel beta-helix repeat protein
MMLQARMCAAAVALGSAMCAFAGPITPPPGPVVSTPGPEPRTAINAVNTPGDADSVYRISTPGSYYLAGNVVGTSGKRGIEIASNDVTIDLNGFAMLGATGSDSGIETLSGFVGVRIHNGVISGWGDDGVAMPFGGGGSTLIEDLVVVGNADSGIGCGTGAIVRACVARSNGGLGIYAGSACKIIECASISNGGTGILVGDGSVVANCVSISNADDGMYLSGGSRAIENNVTQNGLDGIFLSGESVATGNFCGSNGRLGAGAGITGSGSNSRIEDNTCIDNDWGVRVTDAGNFIARNVASNNATANWNIVSGNACLVVQTLPSPTINGSFGGISPGSNDPNANFTY